MKKVKRKTRGQKEKKGGVRRCLTPSVPVLFCSPYNVPHFSFATRDIFWGPLVLSVVADQSSSSAVSPLVARPHTTAEGILGPTVAPGEAKNTDRGTKWVLGYRREALGVGDEELHGRLGWFQPWETAGVPLTSRLVEVNPVTTAIRSKSLAWNITNVCELLNCIMDMVEKTRRSLTVLRRCQEADREEMNHWIRRYSDVEEMKKGGSNGQHCLPPPPLPPPTPHHNSSSNTASGSESLPIGTPSAAERQTGRQTEIHRDFLHRPPSGYLPEEIWRKAGTTSIPLSPALKHLQNKQEEAVNEVKRQAMSELQKAVSDAERKAHEMISAERSKMERALAEAKRQASEDALTVINQQEDSSESCWNCGRKASETCSGCNTARYCGSFCQHKDWEKHHHVCGQGLQGLPGGSSVPLGTPSSSSASSGAPPTHSESTPPGSLSLAGQSSIAGGPGSGGGSVSASPKESSSSSASRSTTPATPALLDATSR
nr:PREDICTED: protein CBFA2T3-like [Paralichthys olivaceus]